ncbi:MAG TPA: TetR/AcrR family transcriptional regulator [Micromonosporaceae bacterium]|nr:TetR/AcrR family transcriptional regulator [Micromonosporaceae bacterium]
MARTINEQEYAARRTAILEAAHQLIVTKGYQQMSIQDLLDVLGISKGAFYHYFESKPALLTALIDRLIAGWERELVPIAESDELPALECLRRFFAVLARAKTGDQAFLLSTLRVLYSDDNAVVLQKSRAAGQRRFAPLLTQIITRGVDEGVFDTSHPEHVGQAVVALVQDLVEQAGHLMLEYAGRPDGPGAIEKVFAVYIEVLERALGIPAGSLELIDQQTLRQWMPARSETNTDPAYQP